MKAQTMLAACAALWWLIYLINQEVMFLITAVTFSVAWTVSMTRVDQ